MAVITYKKKTNFSMRVSKKDAEEMTLKRNEFRKKTGHPLIPVLEQTRFVMPMKKCPLPNCTNQIKATWLCCDECRAKMNELKKIHSLSI